MAGAVVAVVFVVVVRFVFAVLQFVAAIVVVELG